MAKHLPLAGGHVSGFGATERKDDWKTGPAVTLFGLLAFVVYVNWALFQGEHYYAEPYLSPFYSPVLYTDTAAAGAAPLSHAWLGAWPSWWPEFLPHSPAILILVFPALFRGTCYYYRKAYYRAFAGSPPGCAVGPMSQRHYNGETKLLLLQNLHRYALYAALVYIVILYYDGFIAFSKGGELGVGVGTIVLLINATLIACYTLGCHSFRHLIGGRDDCMSCGQNTMKYGLWSKATWFNGRHMPFAWASLVWVMVTDVYIRLVSMGIITDLNTWN
ncbi:MAG: hypothetical protein AAF721_21960 [Myxococcota bacterium]